MQHRLTASLCCALSLAASACGSSTGHAGGGVDAGLTSPGDASFPDGAGRDTGASPPLDGGSGDADAGAGPGADGGCADGDGGPGTFTCTGSLTVAREVPGGAVLPGGKVLIAGGWNSTSQTLSSAELYDPASGTFAPTGSMSSGHLYAGAPGPWPVLSNGKVLAAGGLDASGALLATAELYDPTAGTFSPATEMAVAVVSYFPVTLQDGSALFVGGYSAVAGGPPTPAFTYTAGTDLAQRYDPVAGTFTETLPLDEERLFGCNVLLPSGKVLAIGGYQGVPAEFESTIEQYYPATTQWAVAGVLAAGVTCSAGAFALPSGQVLLADGSDLLDPTAFTTTPGTNPLASVDGVAFVQLASGDVLACGGLVNNVPVTTAQVYHDATSAWAPVGNLRQPRASARLFLLPSGEVLVVGGDVSGMSAEIYHP